MYVGDAHGKPLLETLALGEREIAEGKVASQEEVATRMRSRLNAPHPSPAGRGSTRSWTATRAYRSCGDRSPHPQRPNKKTRRA